MRELVLQPTCAGRDVCNGRAEVQDVDEAVLLREEGEAGATRQEDHTGLCTREGGGGEGEKEKP